MTDYIKRDKIIEILAQRFNQYTDFVGDGTARKNEIFWCVKKIKAQPAADVRENVHGKWIVIIEKDADGNGYYNCSVCGAGESHVPSYTVSYCWNCGARMDGGDEQ